MDEKKTLAEICKEMKNAEKRLFETAPKMQDADWWENGGEEKNMQEK